MFLEDDLEQLVRNFPQAISKLLEEIRENNNGILIILDDLDAISDEESFANWYKSFVDEVATHFQEFPVTFILIGLPEIVDNLATLQPSLPRIFNIIELDRLTNEEVSEFLIRAFKK